MLPNPRYGRRKSFGSAVAPGTELGTRVGSWFCGWNVAPNGRALICTCRSKSPELEPTYATSRITSLTSLCCTPTFHWFTRGGLKPYAVGFSDSVGNGSPPAEVTSCSRPQSTLEFNTPGALEIMSNTMLPCGRS